MISSIDMYQFIIHTFFQMEDENILFQLIITKYFTLENMMLCCIKKDDLWWI